MRGLVVVIALLWGCGPLPPPAPPRQTSLGIHLSSYALGNGLRVVLVQDPRAVEVSVTMRYQVGAVDDPAGQAGIAHLVEHLMYQQVLGTQSLFAHLEDITTDFNGFTSQDATVYTARAAPVHLDQLLSIEAVRLGFRCTTITDETFEREREVVLNELRQRDEATQIYDALGRGLYPEGHPYRRPAGAEASVAAISRTQACAFADAHYAPRNAVLVVSGDLAPDRLQGALRKFLARVPARAAVPALPVAQVSSTGRRTEIKAAVDDAVLVVAWPLTTDPRRRAQVRAVLAATARAVDEAVRGRVVTLELGDERAPMVALAVLPADDETIAQVTAGVKHGIEAAARGFLAQGLPGELMFDRTQQAAIYAQYAGLEDESARDARLAGYVLGGRDPSEALGAEFVGIRELTAGEAASIAATELGFARATLIELAPDGTRRGHAAALGAPIHDIGQRRDPPDPARAHQPAEPRALPTFAGMQTRRLPNGLSVVLLPLTSVPTVDARLVFGAGTADEPPDRRGAALVAAYALTWDLHYLNDLLLFAAAGGSVVVDLDTDHTSFVARGLDMHLDLLLAGLRRWIREGRYGSGAAGVANALRDDAKRTDDDGAATDAWRVAQYGPGHPYVAAGLSRHASMALDVDDGARFRAAHFTPDNATLLISGHFDAALADRWIDFLFADWTGTAEEPVAARAAPHATSLARDAATAQIRLALAIPAVAGTRAQRLVAAGMLAALAGDVRHELGASYGLQAGLVERRLATTYELAGSVEAGRANEAVLLIRDRLAQLRADPAAAARAFVTARERVLTQLLAATGSAATLAERVQRDVELGRTPLSDLEAANAVRTLAVDGMGATLADLDLARATVLMQGPPAEVDAAFGALGRVATHLRTVDSERPRIAPRATAADDDTPTDFEPPLTAQAPRQPWFAMAGAGYALGRVNQHDLAGPGVDAAVGLQLTGASIGLHGAIAHATGSYSAGVQIALLQRPIEATPIELGAFVQTSAADRFWANLEVGLRLDRVSDFAMPVDWRTTLNIGLAGGIDVLAVGREQLGIYARIDSDLLVTGGFAALTFGVALRR